MGLFEERKSISDSRLRESFRRDSGRIPKSYGRRYNSRERLEITKEVLGSRHRISERDYGKTIKELDKERKTTKPYSDERKEVIDKLNYLKEMGSESDGE
jgi:hypothetical protein